MKEQKWKKWLKQKPTAFCSGCQYGIVLNYLTKALDMTEINRKNSVFVSGIGCAGWITDLYLNANTAHVTHGRPIPVATGIKLANPELNVIVVSGDGDLATIGTNHLVHAARRDINITIICANNFLYGMTGGQVGATTPQNAVTSTTKEGNPDQPLDLMQLVLACNCSFAARYPALMLKAPQKIPAIISKGIKHRGFTFIELVAPCATHFAGKNKILPEPAFCFGSFNNLSQYLKTKGE